MYLHPNDYLAVFHTRERELQQAAALERQIRQARGARPLLWSRLALHLKRHAIQLRPRAA